MLFFLPAAFLLAAHRAFISWESLFRPASVSPPFFRAASLTPVRFSFAHRAFAAAESFALVAADTFFQQSLTLDAIKLCRELKRDVFPGYRSAGRRK
jgi:hypothetical protein